MKTKTQFIILISVVGLIIIAFVFVMTNLIKDSSECTSNPFTYGNRLIVDNSGDYVYTVCSCQVGSIGNFYFDDKKLYTEHPLYPKYSEPIKKEIDNFNLSMYLRR